MSLNAKILRTIINILKEIVHENGDTNRKWSLENTRCGSPSLESFRSFHLLISANPKWIRETINTQMILNDINDSVLNDCYMNSHVRVQKNIKIIIIKIKYPDENFLYVSRNTCIFLGRNFST